MEESEIHQDESRLESIAEKSPLFCRLFGLGNIGLYTFINVTTDNAFLDVVSYILIVEGLGDVITGKHRYLISKLFCDYLKLIK